MGSIVTRSPSATSVTPAPTSVTDAGELVADDQRHRLAGQRVWLIGWNEDRPVVVLVQVGAADAVAADPDFDLAFAGRGLGDVLDLEFVVSVVHRCAHDFS